MRCTRPTASRTSTCRARRRAYGLRCRGAPSRHNDRPRSRANDMSPPQGTGEAAEEIRHLVPDVETLGRRLASVDYLVEEGLATSMFLSLRLPQPLLLEGEAGVGKTEGATMLAVVI